MFGNENGKVEKRKLNYYNTLLLKIKWWKSGVIWYFSYQFHFFHLFFSIWKENKMVNSSEKLHPPTKIKRKTPIYFFKVLENFDIVMINQSYSKCHYLKLYNYYFFISISMFLGKCPRAEIIGQSLNKILLDLYQKIHWDAYINITC